jgi:hypothetical protein
VRCNGSAIATGSEASHPRVPPEFRAVLDGRVAPEDAAPETLHYLDSILPSGGEVPDTIGEQIFSLG